MRYSESPSKIFDKAKELLTDSRDLLSDDQPDEAKELAIKAAKLLSVLEPETAEERETYDSMKHASLDLVQGELA